MNANNLKGLLTTYWFGALAEYQEKYNVILNINVRDARIEMKKAGHTDNIVYYWLQLHNDLGLATTLQEENVVAQPEDETPEDSAPIPNTDGPVTDPEVGQGIIESADEDVDPREEDPDAEE